VATQGLHAVSSHENSSVADVEKDPEARDVVNHAHNCNQILEIPVSHSFRSDPRLGARIVERRPQDGAQAILRSLLHLDAKEWKRRKKAADEGVRELKRFVRHEERRQPADEQP
jgi:hypothetical protein